MIRKGAIAALALASSLFSVGAFSTAGISTGSSAAAPKLEASHPKYTIALLNGDNADPYFLTVWHGAYVEAKKLGVNLIEEAPATFNYDQQEPLMSDLIAKKVSAIILSADGTGNSYNALLAQAHSKGIPVIIVNETAGDMNNNKDALSFITSSNTALSALAGKEVAKLMGGKGVLGVINSSVTVISDLQRVTGLQSYLKANDPKIQVLPQQIDGDNISTASQDATDLMESHSNLKAIYTVDSFGGQGVGTAVKAAGKAGKIKVVAIDAEPQEIQLMKQGVIQALVAQQPYYVGTLSMQYAVDALTGHKNLIKRSVEPAGIIVTPQNVNSAKMKSVIYQTWHP